MPRRTVLRAVAVTTATVLLGGGLLAGNAAAAQHLWMSCKRCGGLWFTGNGTRGTCPAGDWLDGGHHPVGLDHVLKTEEDSGAGQRGWRWCSRCQGLYFESSRGNGFCPAYPFFHFPIDGGRGVTSARYVVEDRGNLDRPGYGGWRWCFKCEGLYDLASYPHFSGSVCPRDKQPHGRTGGDYVVRRFGATR
ncbi:hypothetical protein [Streptomyces sp. NPDC002187]|uniref:hypothetical protein n=1 Tax=Streptomyces sp. NPDC002187 TaxID=3364637 RepID=UPI0036B35A69